jgi:hypothetical protein
MLIVTRSFMSVVPRVSLLPQHPEERTRSQAVVGSFRALVLIRGLDTRAGARVQCSRLIPLRSAMRASSFFAFCLIVLGLAAPDGRADGRPPVGGYDWTGWVSQGGVAVSAPECVSGGGAGIACFVRGQDGQLWRRAFDGREWQAWAKLTGVANAATYEARPECVFAGGRVECFVRRHGDGTMFRRTWSGGYVHSWENLGGTLASDPDCVTQKPEGIDCFARGEDGALWQNSFNGDAWTGWVSRGGDIAEGTKPACALRSAGKIECLAVWDDKGLRHMSIGSDGWDEVDDDIAAASPATENMLPSPKCYGAPDDARVDCFMPVADEGRRALMYLRYDGSWTLDDLSSDFGRETAGPDRELAHYDFDCVVRANTRFDCMELAAWRGYKGAAADGGRAVRFRHYAYALGGPPAQWRNVPLTMPVQAGNVSFLKCLSVDGERLDCFTGGSWQGNSTLNQASFVYQERIVFKPMKPVR